MAEKSTIARPYAQAVFELAKEQGDYAVWSEMLQRAASISLVPEMVELMSSPRVSKEDAASLLIELCGDALNKQGQDFIHVLTSSQRAAVLPEIAVLYEQQRAEAESTVQAEVVSALPLDSAQQEKISAALAKRLGKKVSLECRVDDALIGGAVIRAGDLVIDGSAQGKLGRLANVLEG
jgi:F-type H+-transporting ATPase subunit delta